MASLVLAACSAKPVPTNRPSPPAPPGPSTQESYRQAADAFFDAYMEHFPVTAVGLGLHQYDGKLPDMTAAGLKGLGEWLAAQRAVIEGFPAAELDLESQVERDALLATIRGEIFDLEVLRKPFSNPISYSEDLELTQYIARCATRRPATWPPPRPTCRRRCRAPSSRPRCSLSTA